MANGYEIQALQRGIRLLGTLLELGRPASLDALARRTWRRVDGAWSRDPRGGAA